MIEMLAIILFCTLFFAIPAILFVLFCLGLYRYCSAKKQNKKAPDTFSEAEIKKRKVFLIVSCVVMCVFVAVVIGFMTLMGLALDSM